MFATRSWRSWLAALATVALAACGGGGSDGGDSPFGGGGGGGSGTQKVSRLSMVLTNANGAPVSSLSNSGTEQITVKVTALDSNNTVVPGAVVGFSVAGAQVAPADTLTDDQGAITAQVGIGDDRSNRQVTVVASAENNSVRASAQFLVTGAKLSGTTPPLVTPGGLIVAEYLLEDGSKNPMIGEVVTLAYGGTTVGTQTTSSTGKVTFRFGAPATPGTLTLVASSAGTTLESDVQVQAATVPVAVGTITSATVSANPSVVSVNTTSTDNATTIRALFRGASNAAIPNVRVWFTLPDPNSVGGAMKNTGLVYSDATGVASNEYVPGPRSSPTDGVEVLACYSNTDFTVPTTQGVCPAGTSSARTRLTVVDDALRVDIGTDELVGAGTGTYTKDFVVIVVDAAGRAKADVEVTARLDLTGFYKGIYGWDGNKWVRDPATSTGILHGPRCANEDVNRNGTLEVGEDLNGNGELDPGGVSISPVGSTKTDANGKALLRLEYPRDRATWIDYTITVTARVGGSEGLRVYRGNLDGLGNLPAPGTSFTQETVFPAFGVSPYGRTPGCNNFN